MNYRNAKILRAAKDSPCQLCGADDKTIVAAHSNQLRDGKGRSIKAHDYRIAALCYTCHSDIDQGKMSREDKQDLWEMAHRKTIGWLFENDHLDIK